MAEKTRFVDRIWPFSGDGEDLETRPRSGGEVWNFCVLSGDSEHTANLVRVLTGLGHTVEKCLNIRSFRHKVRRLKPQVLFLDWNLPVGVPEVVLDFIHNRDDLAGIRVIGIADRERIGGWEDMVSCGCADVMPLPAPDALIRAKLSLITVGDRGGDLETDELTGCLGAAGFGKRLREAFAEARRSDSKPFAVLCLGIDNFTRVTDGLGRAVGERLLRAVAERLAVVDLKAAAIARFEGDRFFLLVEDVADAAAASSVTHHLSQECRRAFDLGSMELFSSVSIGLAVWDKSYIEPGVLMRDAEIAFHRAVMAGRNSRVVFEPEMHRTAVAALDLENDLRRAIENREFRPYFQPILSVASGRITGFEALARWHHPERGILEPAEFIATAEKTGVIIQIDRLMVEEACRQLRAWQLQFKDCGPLSVSVNISTQQFLRSDLVQQIDLVLRSTGLYGKSLKLEVTESVLMEHSEYASQMLQQLRKLEIGISIDDFGTGYSSFTYLRQLEIDILKIDRTFVSGMTEDDDSAKIVATVATLARNLGKVTVAEGVETRSQFDALRELGVENIQGYFVAPPLSAQGAEALLEQACGSENHLEKILGDRLRGN